MSIKPINIIKYNLPGAILSVEQSGEWVHHHCSGLADIEKNKKLTEHHLFHNDKITRLFTAILALKLVEAEVVRLDTPLELMANRHQLDGGRLKILVNLYPFLKPLTLRELLNQTSGLPAYEETLSYQKAFLGNPKKVWQVESYFDIITEPVRYRQGYEVPVRGVFSESNTNYVLVSFLLEALTGKKITDQMQELFAGLKLKNSVYATQVDEKLLPQLAHGYLPLSHPLADAFSNLKTLTYNNNRELCVYDVTSAYYSNGLGGTASFSTTADLVHVMKELVHGKILTSSIKEMFTVVPINGKNGNSEMKNYFGLGIYKTVSQKYGEIIWNAGNGYGYSALIAHAVNKNLTFCLATNISRHQISLQNKDLVPEILSEVFAV